MSRRLAWVGGLVIVAMFAAGLGVALAVNGSSGKLGVGPLGRGGEASSECAPASATGVPVTFGIVVLPNAGRSAVTITSVGLSHERGLNLLRSFVVPIIGNTLIGVQSYPPTIGRAAWAQRKAAVGAQVKPRVTMNLVLAVAATKRPDGLSGGAVVDYSSGGNSYVMDSQIAYQVAVSPAHC